jgi:nitroreductase
MIGDLDEALATTRSIRRRLAFGEPVDRALIRACLEQAVQAPNGGNRQGWRFVVVDDQTVIGQFADYYRKASEAYFAADTGMDPQVREAAQLLARRMHEVPALVVGCLAGRLAPGASAREMSGFYGSIYPALWSFMLAASARRLGTSLTTAHLAYEREVADVLGIPYETTTQVAAVTVGHILGGGVGRGPRRPADEVLAWNRWRESAG